MRPHFTLDRIDLIHDTHYRCIRPAWTDGLLDCSNRRLLFRVYKNSTAITWQYLIIFLAREIPRDIAFIPSILARVQRGVYRE